MLLGGLSRKTAYVIGMMILHSGVRRCRVGTWVAKRSGMLQLPRPERPPRPVEPDPVLLPECPHFFSVRAGLIGMHADFKMTRSTLDETHQLLDDLDHQLELQNIMMHALRGGYRRHLFPLVPDGPAETQRKVDAMTGIGDEWLIAEPSGRMTMELSN